MIKPFGVTLDFL